MGVTVRYYTVILDKFDISLGAGLGIESFIEDEVYFGFVSPKFELGMNVPVFISERGHVFCLGFTLTTLLNVLSTRDDYSSYTSDGVPLQAGADFVISYCF